ncbi:SUMF1/EgtB/PvdO family nonheme iron enzyme, partial [Acidobacteria bacterium AH-259-O06]|nr:SUMF1/EgtB/PvdO family nonheme iron enzyme [Acidobacteria bacterium AH-259-O06]
GTEPAGAQVFVKGYSAPDTPWELLGETPLEQVSIPYALMRWRIVKEGFETFEGAPFGLQSLRALAALKLEPLGSRPPRMVRVPGGRTVHRPSIPTVQLGDYWLDRFEVTNREYQTFVRAGGYQTREYWTEPFVDETGELSWDEATARFRDATGRPGPATWELGTYPEGHDEYPVGGISWYEAAAYCESVGKRLPTVVHWFKALGREQFSDMLHLSNFGDGPVSVGSLGGLGAYGTYDMAGNVKEWAWNATEGATEGGRYILGGAWGEPTYMVQNLDARRPFDRAAAYGVRCARYEELLPETLADIPLPSPEFVRLEPVGDEVFEVYRRMYAYDRSELNAAVEAVDDQSPHWRKELVSFDAAYGGERVTALLFLPSDVAPPYQAVIWFPAFDALSLRSSERLASEFLFDFIPRSGRALVYPIYKGMYERYAPFRGPNDFRDRVFQWSKDLGRTVDYLETRADIDPRKLAYYGFSLGAWFGPIFQTIDSRFAASVLLSAGICLFNTKQQVGPELNAVNFAPQSTVPTLMINGRDDFILSMNESQLPLFDLLGAPGDNKRHAVVEGGHIPSDRHEMIREILDWLDRFLGPVGPRAPG